MGLSSIIFMKHIKSIKTVISISAFLIFCLPFSPVRAADQLVANNNDSGAGSLRQAIADVGVGETITFNLSSGNETIILASTLTVDKNLTIDGDNTAGSGVNVTLDGNNSQRILLVNQEKSLTMTNITLTNGYRNSINNGGAIYFNGIGLGGSTIPNLTMTNVTVSNSSAGLGGGVYVRTRTTLNMTNCKIKDNTATGDGVGGIYIDGGNVTMTQCLISGNDANTGYGGGMSFWYSAGAGFAVTLDRCTIANNTASNGQGGGMHIWCLNAGTMLIKNCTFSGNSASSDGAGIYHRGSCSLTLRNTILAGNTDAATRYDYFYHSGTLTDGGYNVVEYSNKAANAGGFSSATSILYNTKYNTAGTTETTWTQEGVATSNTALDLDALLDNGGDTLTMAVSANSVARSALPYGAGANTWNDSTMSGGKYYDQRGTVEIAANIPVDIGAYSDLPLCHYRSKISGNWNETATWEQSLNGSDWENATVTPDADNLTITIRNDHTVTVTENVTTDQTTVESGGTIAINFGVTLSIANGDGTDLQGRGNLGINGTMAIADGAAVDADGTFDATGGAVTSYSGGALNLGGTVTSLGTFTPATGTVTYDGTNQTLPAGTSFYNLKINASGIVTLSGNVTVGGTLILTDGAGLIDTNGHTLIANGAIENDSGGSGIDAFDIDHMIISNGTGKLRRPASAGGHQFPMGTNNGSAQYTPATLNFTGGTFGGGAYAEIGVKDAKQPNNTSPTNYLNRYWTVTQSGITGFSCDTTFNYAAADVTGTEADIYGADYNGSAWTTFNAVDSVNHKFSCSNVGSFSDFTGIASYTVTYGANGATSGTAPDDQTKINGVDLTLQTNTGSLARTGYAFSGWNTAADGSGTHHDAGATYTSNAALALYAQWSGNAYTVTFDKQGGTGGSNSVSATYGSAMPAATPPTRTGYTFAGYCTGTGGSGTQYYTASMASSRMWDVAANTTLYAEWTTNTYTVTYNANGATGGSVPVDESSPYAQGATVTVLGNTGDLVRTGFIFSDWNTLADGSGSQYAPVATFNMPGSNVTLYAQWNTGSTRYVCSDGVCGGNTPCHKTISEAIQAASTGTLIKIAAESHDGSFSLNAAKFLTLQGGWDASFNDPNGGTTTLQGAPKAPQGSLTLQNLRIVP